MDGIFRHDPPNIEEIETTFNIGELERRLAGGAGPSLLSAAFDYGYFYWL